jgi:hypothetical protein
MHTMKTTRLLSALMTHTLAIVIGFALGIYALPILIAPPAPDLSIVTRTAENSLYVGHFSRDRKDSDLLHWGEGEFSISTEHVSFSGALAPGPDYRLYFSPEFVETEADFMRLKPEMVQVGHIKTFENFVVEIPEGIDPAKYQAAIIWCESFRQFITSGSYSQRQAGP